MSGWSADLKCWWFSRWQFLSESTPQQDFREKRLLSVRYKRRSGNYPNTSLFFSKMFHFLILKQLCLKSKLCFQGRGGWGGEGGWVYGQVKYSRFIWNDISEKIWKKLFPCLGEPISSPWPDVWRKSARPGVFVSSPTQKIEVHLPKSFLQLCLDKVFFHSPYKLFCCYFKSFRALPLASILNDEQSDPFSLLPNSHWLFCH